MSDQTYRKVIVQRFSPNVREAVKVVEVPLTQPAPNELLVRNYFTGINFMDVSQLTGRTHFAITPPFDLGIEAAGEVVAVGSAVENYQPGDRVVTALFGNGFREYSLIDANLAIPVDDITPEVTSLMISGSRASVALNVVARMQSGDQTVLVTAGVSGSGHYAVQIAKLAGNHVIGCCGHASEIPILESLGCDRVIQRDSDDLDAILKAEYPDGVNLVYESIGGRIFDICLDNIAPRGRLILSDVYAEHTHRAAPVHTVDIYDKLIWKAATLHGFNILEYAQFMPSHARKVMDLHEQGKLKTVLDPQSFKGIEQISDALEHVVSWKSQGKVVIDLR